MNTYTRMLLSAAATSDAVRGLIADGLREALGGPPVSRMNAQEIQRSIAELGTSPDLLGLTTVKRYHTKSLPDDPEADWAAFWTTLRAYSDPDTAEVLDTVGALLQRVSAKGMAIEWRRKLLANLYDPDVAFIVEAALVPVADASPLLIASLRHDVLPTLWRRPVDNAP